MVEFVRVRSVDAPGEYLVPRVRAVKYPDRYVIVDGTDVRVDDSSGGYIPEVITTLPDQGAPAE